MYKTIIFGVVALAAVCAAQDVKCPAEDPKNTTVMLPYPNDCTKFYMCYNGQPIQMNCPWGTYFNANKSICDWPSSSGCVQPNPPSVCNPADLVPLYPVPNNCSAFISCTGSKQIQMECPAGLYFNPSLKVCDWPQNSGCVQPSSTNIAPSEGSTTFSSTPEQETLSTMGLTKVKLMRYNWRKNHYNY